MSVETPSQSGIGFRLDRAIRSFYRGVSLHPAVLQLAEATGLSVSQINRIRSGKTRHPHRRTLQSLAEKLNTTVEDLRDGATNEQLDAFALTFPTKREAETTDPTLKVEVTLRTIHRYPRQIQIRACRAAVSAILEAVAEAGEWMPEAYQALAYLDGLQKSVTRGE